MSAKRRVLTFTPASSAQPSSPFRGVPRTLRKRLRHNFDAATPLNDESLGFGHLYQHASTDLRKKLYRLLAENPCECLGCTRARAYGDV